MKIEEVEIEQLDANSVWVGCPHGYREYFMVMGDGLYYFHCRSCHQRIIGYAMMEIVEPIEKLFKFGNYGVLPKGE